MLPDVQMLRDTAVNISTSLSARLQACVILHVIWVIVILPYVNL